MAPTSPDLLPIENIWKLLKAEDAQENYSNNEELWEAVQKNLKKLLSDCQNLIDSMPRRCQEIIDNKGLVTHY